MCATVSVSAAVLAAVGGFAWAGFVSLYVLIIGMIAFRFGWESFSDSREATSLFDGVTRGTGKPLPFSEFLVSYGDVWWERLLPTQRGPTFLAWPGVIWESSEVPL
jgi:hypothetical protein